MLSRSKLLCPKIFWLKRFAKGCLWAGWHYFAMLFAVPVHVLKATAHFLVSLLASFWTSFVRIAFGALCLLLGS